MNEKEDIRKRQIFANLVRILPSIENEVHIILRKDKITEDFLNFVKELEGRYKGEDVILTFTKLIRNKKMKRGF